MLALSVFDIKWYDVESVLGFRHFTSGVYSGETEMAVKVRC